MLQRLSVRGKILAVVAVPILVLLLAAGVLTTTAINNLNQARNTVAMLTMLDRGKSFSSAWRIEADAAANYVSAWNDNSSLLLTSRTNVDRDLELLEGFASSGENEAFVWESVQTALQGGQAIEGGQALSLAEARAVEPVASEDGLSHTWPDASQVSLAVASVNTIAAEISRGALGVTLSPQAQTAVNSVMANLGLEAERQFMFLDETPRIRQDFDNAVAPVDNALNVFRSAVQSVPRGAQTEAVYGPLDAMEIKVAELAEAREGVRGLGWGDVQTHSWYGAVMTDMSLVISQTILAVNNAELAQWLSAFEAVDTLMQELNSEGSQIARALRPGQFLAGEQALISTQVARTDFALDRAQQSVATLDAGFEVPDWGASSDAASQSGFAPERTRVTQNVLSFAARSTWPGQVATERDAIQPAYDATLSGARDIAADAENAVVLSTVITAIVSLIVVALSLIVALVIARSIVNPLRRLTTTATAVRQELPRLVERVALPGETVDVSEVQIPVESTDEVGRLAEAFNSVNAATLAIASEQAALRGSISEMFVNVARRDQVLLNRQLSSIDEMERTQDDPDTLTKLFALDHLATRMRRNSESLLVLAGIDTGRRLRRPMPLSDVVRTASSEIELYERVQLELDVDPSMLGHSALTAAHLFAELLENATVFSDPGTPVVVQTAYEGDSFVVRISDSGIGMAPDELAEANNRVASTAASEILGAQRLGLFVVGRIARRIGARVSLQSEEGRGTVATVTMSPSLFDLSSPDADMPHASGSATDTAMHAPAALTSRDLSNEVVDSAPHATSVSERAGSAAAQLESYAPAVIEEGTSLSGRPAMSDGLEGLLAEDAAAAPAAEAVDLDALTEGVTPSGLPTRRKRTGESDAVSSDEARHTAIGLPARATDAQLSALAEQTDTGFTPLVPAPEVSEVAEQRAAMFRGFRSRRSGPDGAIEVAPDAESLGQAMRRGAAVAPEPVVATAPVVPMLEPDEDDVTSVEPVAEVAPVAPAQSPLIRSGYGDVDAPTQSGSVQVPALEDQVSVPMEVPGLVDDVPDLSDSGDEGTQAPLLSPDHEPVEELPTVQAEPIAPQYNAPEVLSPYTQPPYGYAQEAPANNEQPTFEASPSGFPVSGEAQHVSPEAPIYATEQAPAQASFEAASAWEQPARAAVFPGPAQPFPAAPEPLVTPSLDDVIGAPSSKDKGGFFGKLFRKDKEPAGAEQSAATAMLSSMPHTAPLPGFTAPEAPSYPAANPPALAPQVLPGQGDTAGVSALASPLYRAPAVPATPAPSALTQQQTEAPSGFGGYGQETAPSWGAPGDGAYGVSAPHSVGEDHYYTRDELAKPLGWETAGETALQAAAPEQMTYHPVVQVATPQVVDNTPDITSDVFSEFQSLTAERPKVTKAGLQRRRPVDAPAPEVTPIEETVEVVHVDRDPNAIKNRFSSFYSGTKRAKADVAEFERGAHGQSTEN